MRALVWLMAWLPAAWRPTAVLITCERQLAWRTLKAAHLQKEPECQACGRRTNLDVHHVIPVSFNPGRELDPENLITLCATPCHIVFGHLLSYHCYNKDVRRMVADYRRAVRNRDCLERFK